MTNLTGQPIYQKGEKPAVSKKIRAASRGATCTLQIPFVCSHNPEQVVFCHLRMFGLAGVAQKPDDLFGIDACHKCHSVLDDRSAWEKAGLTYEHILGALITSQRIRRKTGLIILQGENDEQ